MYQVADSVQAGRKAKPVELQTTVAVFAATHMLGKNHNHIRQAAKAYMRNSESQYWMQYAMRGCDNDGDWSRLRSIVIGLSEPICSTLCMQLGKSELSWWQHGMMQRLAD